MKIFFFAFFLTCSSVFSVDLVQSRFVGPVRLHVWEHEQPSWNVDRDLSLPHRFELERGITTRQEHYVQLIYRPEVIKSDVTYSARLSGRAHYRTGDYSDEERDIGDLNIEGRFEDGKIIFRSITPRFVDLSGKQVVNRIALSVMENGQSIYDYSVSPMFVRGRHVFHWGKDIDPYMAHAGEGTIWVANGANSEGQDPARKDYWDGVLVRPTLDFTDVNFFRDGGRFGLHRHERNQEMWVIINGAVTVTHVMAPVCSQPYDVVRVWRKNETRSTKQFDAEGGWLETREVYPGEFTVIVPNPANPHVVCAHGLAAKASAMTLTMGTKN